jgi:hypothetical protein
MEGALSLLPDWKATWLRILHDKLGLKPFHLRWVLHALYINQKSERMSYLKLRLTAFLEQKASGFQGIITGDESWFFFRCPRDLVWAASRDQLLHRIKQKTGTEKCLVSIFWLANGIHCLRDVPKGTMYNTALFIDAIMSSLIENVCSRTHKETLKG